MTSQREKEYQERLAAHDREITRLKGKLREIKSIVKWDDTETSKEILAIIEGEGS